MASDLIQELFLKLWIKRDVLSVKGELQGYLTVLSEESYYRSLQQRNGTE
jgi:DNA-directed RNA polymerase specialized sigma24 family protein